MEARGREKPGRALVADLRPSFERLAEAARRVMADQDPVLAQRLGIARERGFALADPSHAAEQDRMAGLSRLLQAFEAADPAKLSPVQAMERLLAGNALAGRIALWKVRSPSRMLPHLCVQEAVEGICLHWLRAPAGDRGAGLLRLLLGIPAHLSAARRDLTAPPALFTDLAAKTAQAALEYLSCEVASWIARTSPLSLRRSLLRAQERALSAVEEYAEFLSSNLIARSVGEARLGASEYRALLRETLGLSCEPQDLVLLGERVYHQTLREIRETAAALEPGANWSRLLRRLHEEPIEGSVERAYATRLQAWPRSLASEGLAPPPEQSLRVERMPVFYRALYPVSRYLGPGAGAEPAVLWIALAGPLDPPRLQRALLRAHSRFAIQVRLARQAGPGRHLQQLRARESGRILRLLFPHPLGEEGWASYAEGLRFDAPECDGRLRMVHLRRRLLEACRMIVDVGLHTGKLSHLEAVAFLVRKAKLDRPVAAAEVRRHLVFPGTALCSVPGRLLIEQLRADHLASPGRGREATRAAAGAAARFHRELLSLGPLPPELLRREMGLPRRAAGDSPLSLCAGPFRVRRSLGMRRPARGRAE